MIPISPIGYALKLVTNNKNEDGTPHRQVAMGEYILQHIHSRLYYKVDLSKPDYLGPIITDPDQFESHTVCQSMEDVLEGAENMSVHEILQAYRLPGKGLELSLMRSFEAAARNWPKPYVSDAPELSRYIINAADCDSQTFKAVIPQRVDILEITNLRGHILEIEMAGVSWRDFDISMSGLLQPVHYETEVISGNCLKVSLFKKTEPLLFLFRGKDD